MTHDVSPSMSYVAPKSEQDVESSAVQPTVNGAVAVGARPAPDATTRCVSPHDFYREAVQREDIRRILAALAK